MACIVGYYPCGTSAWTSNAATSTNTSANNYTTGYDWGTTGSTTVQEFRYFQYNNFDSSMPQWVQYPGYNLYSYSNSNSGWQQILPVQKTAAERLKEILNSRMSPNIISSCRPLGYTQDIRETRARETLLRVLGESKFRDFVRKGSVSIRAKSGLVYQIFPGSTFTKVYDQGKMVERLCVVLQGDFPATDSLIMRYLLLLNNESFFVSKAIKHGIPTPAIINMPDNRSLVDIYKDIKKFAA